MRRRLIGLNTQFKAKGWPSLRHGIGIHTGEALAANIGNHPRPFNNTVSLAPLS